MAKEIYTLITEETVRAASERARVELNELTNGQAQKAIDIVAQIVELDGILEKMAAIKATDKELGL